MCGIVGYIGRRSVAPILLDGLKKLEYRGYDSAGIAVLHDNRFHIVKRQGRVSMLGDAAEIEGTVGIGHTRWATHGAPSEQNAHPHAFGKFSLVHNGIIENYASLKAECLARGEPFSSETDSEVIVHLIAHEYVQGDFLQAVYRALSRLKGSYAIAVLCSDFPDCMIVAREQSPLVVGVGEEGVAVASDFPAIAAEGQKAYSLCDGEIAVLRGAEAIFYDRRLQQIQKERMRETAWAETPNLGSYAHFMRKEIAQIPSAIARSLSEPIPPELFEILRAADRLYIVACGTAYHSGIAAKYAVETLARIPVEVNIASEFRYSDPILSPHALVIAVSQSGETADTIAAARLAKERGVTVVAVCNVVGSSLTAIADFTLYTRAGIEVAVAATKSFNAQLACLYRFALECMRAKGGEVDDRRLLSLPNLAERTIACSESVEKWVETFTRAKCVYFLGRGVDYCSALEGSLKLKEISYLPGEGYPSGELKHGTLALVGTDTPIVVVMTQRALAEKTMNAIHEVESRGACVFLITSLEEYAHATRNTLLIPACEECFSPALAVIPLQMLAYHTAVALGYDPDKPRNLAKSVTVE